jgi:hypothetical protein
VPLPSPADVRQIAQRIEAREAHAVDLVQAGPELGDIRIERARGIRRDAARSGRPAAQQQLGREGSLEIIYDGASMLARGQRIPKASEAVLDRRRNDEQDEQRQNDRHRRNPSPPAKL